MNKKEHCALCQKEFLETDYIVTKKGYKGTRTKYCQNCWHHIKHKYFVPIRKRSFSPLKGNVKNAKKQAGKAENRNPDNLK